MFRPKARSPLGVTYSGATEGSSAQTQYGPCIDLAQKKKLGTSKEDIQDYSGCAADVYCSQYGVPPGVCSKAAKWITGGIYDALDDIFGGGGIDCSKGSSFDACDPCMMLNRGYALMNDPECKKQKAEQAFQDELYVNYMVCLNSNNGFGAEELAAQQELTALFKKLWPKKPVPDFWTLRASLKQQGMIVLGSSCVDMNSAAYQAHSVAVLADYTKKAVEAVASVRPACERVKASWQKNVSAPRLVSSAPGAPSAAPKMIAAALLVGAGAFAAWRVYKHRS